MLGLMWRSVYGSNMGEDASPAAAGVELESPPVQAGGLEDLD